MICSFDGSAIWVVICCRIYYDGIFERFRVLEQFILENSKLIYEEQKAN